MQNDNQWVWLVQVSEYALLLFLLLLLFSSHRLYLTKLLSKEANFFCSVSNSVTTSNNAYNHTYTKPQVRSMTTRQSIIIIIIMMIIVIIILLLLLTSKYCHTMALDVITLLQLNKVYSSSYPDFFFLSPLNSVYYIPLSLESWIPLPSFVNLFCSSVSPSFFIAFMFPLGY